MKKLILLDKKCIKCGNLFGRDSCKSVADYKMKKYCCKRCFFDNNSGKNNYAYKSTKDRILGNIKVNKNGCWIWSGSFRSKGKHGWYGGLKIGGRSVLAHRASYMTFNGDIPKGFLVCHKCDNTKCVNPEHLFLGTQSDNMKDMMCKNRGTSGEKAFHGKLKENQVIEIRNKRGVFRKEIARQYNVSITTVTNIINRRAWAHI